MTKIYCTCDGRKIVINGITTYKKVFLLEIGNVAIVKTKPCEVCKKQTIVIKRESDIIKQFDNIDEDSCLVQHL